MVARTVGAAQKLDPGDPEGKQPVVTPWDGFLTRGELASLYGELTGRDMSSMPWFATLACYKLACLLEGSPAVQRLHPGQAGRRAFLPADEAGAEWHALTGHLVADRLIRAAAAPLAFPQVPEADVSAWNGSC